MWDTIGPWDLKNYSWNGLKTNLNSMNHNDRMNSFVNKIRVYFINGTNKEKPDYDFLRRLPYRVDGNKDDQFPYDWPRLIVTLEIASGLIWTRSMTMTEWAAGLQLKKSP